MKWIFALMICLSAGTASAEVLDLKYGVNEVDINDDGVKDMIVRARWDNLNAHSFDRYLVMVRLKEQYYPEEVYEVPKGNKGPDYYFRTNEGADCLRIGYTFQLDKQRMLVVTQYMADEGTEYYCQPKRVQIITYKLTRGDTEDETLAPYYLKEIKSSKTIRKYDDVTPLMK